MTFPNTVTPHYDEVLLWAKGLHSHVWERRNRLIFWTQTLILFVSVIANSAGQVQTSTYSTLYVDKTTCFLNSWTFSRISGLMVKGKTLCLTLRCDYCPCVSSVCAINCGWCLCSRIFWHIQDYISCAATLLHILLFFFLLLKKILEFFVIFHALHLGCTLEWSHCWWVFFAYFV